MVRWRGYPPAKGWKLYAAARERAGPGLKVTDAIEFPGNPFPALESSGSDPVTWNTRAATGNFDVPSMMAIVSTRKILLSPHKIPHCFSPT